MPGGPVRAPVHPAAVLPEEKVPAPPAAAGVKVTVHPAVLQKAMNPVPLTTLLRKVRM